MDNKDFLWEKIKEKYVEIILCEKKVSVLTHFSAADADFYFQKLEVCRDAKAAITAVLYNKLKQDDQLLLTQEEIFNENDETFEPFILAIVNADADIKKIYDETDIELLSVERFAITYREYWNKHVNVNKFLNIMPPAIKWDESIKNALNQAIMASQQIHKAVNLSGLENIRQIMKPYDFMKNSNLQQFTQDAILSVVEVKPLGWEYICQGAKQYTFLQNSALEQITKSIQTTKYIAEIMSPILDSIKQYADIFSEIISSIDIPKLSETRKQQLLESYRAWGNIGWTMIPHAPIGLFNARPIERQEADKLVLKYFNQDGMKYLFDKLKEKSIRKDDLDSAIFCYENRQYKACILLLLGVIDAKLIRAQKRQKIKRREVCSKAVLKLTQKLEEQYNKSSFFYSMLRYYGTIECLNVFFKNGNDFFKEPDVVNRNFVGHGMNRRKIRKKDCIQVFLALYNLTELLDAVKWK